MKRRDPFPLWLQPSTIDLRQNVKHRICLIWSLLSGSLAWDSPVRPSIKAAKLFILKNAQWSEGKNYQYVPVCNSPTLPGKPPADGPKASLVPPNLTTASWSAPETRGGEVTRWVKFTTAIPTILVVFPPAPHFQALLSPFSAFSVVRYHPGHPHGHHVHTCTPCPALQI